MALQGLDVSLYNRTFNNIRDIARHGGLDVEGVINGHARLSVVTGDLQEAIAGRDIIIVAVPATGHPFMARVVAPHLQPGQVVLLMPGRTGGALEFVEVLARHRAPDDVIVGEAQTYCFVSRTTGPHSVRVSKVKRRVRVSAVPATDTREMLRRLDGVPLKLCAADDVMETGLDNMGAMLHPAPTILNAGLLESWGGGYNHYHDAISPTVGRLIERMDAERVEVARAFGVHATSLLDWFREAYNARGKTLYECIRSTDVYNNIGSPSSLEHRYVLEDVPTGLVPIAYLGRLVGVDTPTIRAVVNLACHLYERSFWMSGRTLERMGLHGMSPEAVMEYVQTGMRLEEEVLLPEVWEPFDLEVDMT